MPARKYPLEERFWPKVEKTDSCWLWTGRIATNGYGRVWNGTKGEPAHRVAYRLVRGPIPEGLELDHLCRVRACVNPDHLEAVTHRENVVRGSGPSARWAAATHCTKGHPYSPENTRADSNGRHCRICERVAHDRYRAAYPDRVRASQGQWRAKAMCPNCATPWTCNGPHLLEGRSR